MPFSIPELIALLRLVRIDSHRFAGVSPPHRRPRIYGGQMIAQSVMAMGQTVDPAHHLHSMHGYFLQPGDVQKDIEFQVDVLREGRNFSTRGVTAFQDGRAIFSAMSSFQVREGDGHAHLQCAPQGPPPEALESEAQFIDRQDGQDGSVRIGGRFFSALIERRSAHWQVLQGAAGAEPHYGIWCRLRERVDVEPLMHHALVAYISDLDLMNTAVRPRGISLWDPRAQAASLDHTMWFHAPMRADRWFYYDLAGVCAVNNRGLGLGGVFQEGLRVISTAQEGLLRFKPG